MRKMKLLIALTTGFMVVTALTSYAGTWAQNGLDWKYKNDDGSYATGWILDKDYYYYLNDNGVMLSDCKTPDGYYVIIDGRLPWNVKSDVVTSVSSSGKTLATEAKAAGYTVHADDIINVFESKATYNQDDIILTRSGNEYTVDIGVRLNNINQKALKQLLRLTGYSNVDELYNTLYQSFEGTRSPINFESFVDIAGHQIKAVNNGNSITYIIK